MAAGAPKYTIADLQGFAERGMIAQREVDKLCGKTDNVRVVAQVADNVRRGKVPNKTEAEFGRMLQARIHRDELVGPLRFESMKLRIADNCWYTPDWMCRAWALGAYMPIFFEVKGAHIWDDAKVKFKAAREMHQWAMFEMWQKTKGEWRRIL